MMNHLRRRRRRGEGVVGIVVEWGVR